MFTSVAQVATTGKISKPLITVAGTMDALLPIKRQARAYEAAVNSNGFGAQYRLYEVQNGNHIESYVNFYPQLVAIQPYAQKAFDLLVDAVEANAPLPPSQCIPTGGRDFAEPIATGPLRQPVYALARRRYAFERAAVVPPAPSFPANFRAHLAWAAHPTQ